MGDAAQARQDRGADRRAVPHALRPAARRAEGRTRKAREAEIATAIEAELQAVESLDEDRILRHFVNAVQAAVRTNFYQLGTDGLPKPLIAIKFASRKVDGMPLPRPLYEIFVYSPRVEGVHLRFGKVARGGIRWSDRPQDFRTEVLGLVKAQQVKNAVIVPVGAKGGFVPKQMPDGAAARGGAGRRRRDLQDVHLDAARPHRQYRTGTAGVIPPPNVVRHDGDDPYLVVAADKGTATFSDIANGISERTRLLARRRLRVRRLGRLRPQEDGHHRARRLGIGEAPFPRDGRRHRQDAVHRGGRRRHVGRRVRQRHAARADDQAASPPSTIATSSSIPRRIRKRASPSASGCSICRARAGRITTRR